MAYQRTEYADKTMFMNSMADRKLKIQLDSIDFHRDSIGKDIDREKKKIQKELADAENLMRNRLCLPGASSASDGAKKLSPRLPRRYSTPQVLLSATMSPRNLSDIDKHSPAATRRRISSEGTSDVGLTERSLISPTRPLSPTSQFLLPPLSQPRRQSLPPISAGGSLVAADTSRIAGEALTTGSLPGTRRGSCSQTGNKSSRACLSPTSLSPRGSPRKGSAANESEIEEVASKVNRFLQRIDLSKQEETSNIDAKEGEEDLTDEGEIDYIHPLTNRTVKRTSTFQPSNFE